MNDPAHILVVDDESNIRLVLRTALASEGYRVDEAPDGRAALASIQRDPPDVMILDLSMPGLDGLGVLTEMKGMPPERTPRVIVLTAYGSIPTAVRATRLGATDFLEKPVVPDEIWEAVDAALHEPRPDMQAAAPTAGVPGGYAGVLDRIRKSLRTADYADAEAMLIKAADLSHDDAAYFNLLGVLYEARRQWRLARKFYGKSVKIDHGYEPAQRNLRRLYELYAFGRSRVPVALGDEPPFAD